VRRNRVGITRGQGAAPNPAMPASSEAGEDAARDAIGSSSLEDVARGWVAADPTGERHDVCTGAEEGVRCTAHLSVPSRGHGMEGGTGGEGLSINSKNVCALQRGHTIY
jgi:hypothetical protein